MNFIILSIIFFGAGTLALWYYHLVPSTEILRRRLPNRISWAGMVLAIVLTLVLWYIFEHSVGFRRVVNIFTLLMGLLIFETVFLLLIRWLKSNLLALILSLVAAGVIVLPSIIDPTFLWRNVIVVIATMGATTLLIRLNILRTWFLFLLTIVWTIYDVWATQTFYSRVLVPVTEPRPGLIFPSVVVGNTSLGSGDFIFLVLFVLIIFKKFGRLPAMIIIAAETVGLLITGAIVVGTDFIIPFLLIMSPIFFITYGILVWRRHKNSSKA